MLSQWHRLNASANNCVKFHFRWNLIRANCSSVSFCRLKHLHQDTKCNDFKMKIVCNQKNQLENFPITFRQMRHTDQHKYISERPLEMHGRSENISQFYFARVTNAESPKLLRKKCE